MKTELEERTKKFSVQVVKSVAAFPKTAEGQILGRQLLRAGTSIGANYRDTNLGSEKQVATLLNEAGQLLAILITIGRKAKTKT